MPNGPNVSSTISSRPVLRTDGRIVSISSGATVRGSITSTEMPSRASSSHAVSVLCTMSARATTVTSVPSRTTAAWPNGISYSLLRHRPFERQQLAMLEEEHRIVAAQGVVSSPLASYGVEGTTTRRPGKWAYIG